MSRHYLFMCGTPRSGTSFMASIVGAHPDIVLGVERYGKRYADRSLAPAHFERDRFFGAEEAKVFGLVDEVFEKRPQPMDEETKSAA